MDWRTVVLASRSWNIKSGRESKAALSGAKMVTLVLLASRMSSCDDLRAAASLLSRADLVRNSSTEQVSSQGGSSVVSVVSVVSVLEGKEMLRLPIRGWSSPTAWAAAIPLGVRWWGRRAGLDRGWRARARSVRSELTELLSWDVCRNNVRRASMVWSAGQTENN